MIILDPRADAALQRWRCGRWGDGRPVTNDGAMARLRIRLFLRAVLPQQVGDGDVTDEVTVAARDERRDGRELGRKVSVGQRGYSSAPVLAGGVCPIKQSQVGLYPIESQTRKG